MRLASGLVAAGLLCLLAPEVRALSLADLVEFPLPEAPGAADLSDPGAFQPLVKGEDYTYTVARIGVHDPSGNQPNPADPATWTVLSYEGTLTFLPDSGYGYEGYDEAPADLLLVLTSLREGHYVPGGALPPRVLGGYLENTLADDDYFFVRDGLDDPAGVITDEEGAYFLALRFGALPGEAQRFHFQIALRQTLDETLYHFNRGFLVRPTPVPEPGTLACVGVALAAMAVAKRPPLGRGRPRCARSALASAALAALRRRCAQK